MIVGLSFVFIIFVVVVDVVCGVRVSYSFAHSFAMRITHSAHRTPHNTNANLKYLETLP